MNLTDTEMIIGGIFLAVLGYKYLLTHTDDDGRIEDQSVKMSNVIEALEEFEYKKVSRLKEGYTEKSIQNQLKTHLLKKYVHVTDEYGIEGINATKIDFDIGHGKVGLELKLAKSLFKTSNLHRLVGQIEDYSNHKYDNDNLIVAVYGEPNHTSERTQLKRIQEKIEEKGAEFAYFEILLK
jgi:hypothetical protein